MKINCVIYLLAVTVWLLVSCAQENVQSKDVALDYGEMYKDSVFLSVEGNLLDNPEAVWDNMPVYSRACDRMHGCLEIDTANNQLKWTVKAASELKISENIYSYILNAWNYDNQMLQKGNRLTKDGIYYGIIYKESGINTRINPIPQVLERGNYSFNHSMEICCDIIKNGKEGDSIDLIDLGDAYYMKESDHFGGYRIYKEDQGSCGTYHYCLSFSASLQKRLPIDLLNLAIAGAVGLYETACNNQHAPLITVRDRRNFRCSTGRG